MTGQSRLMARSKWQLTLSVALAAVVAVTSTGCRSSPVGAVEPAASQRPEARQRTEERRQAPAQTAATQPDDYLTADLRREVEALKRDVAREPTTHATIGARTDVLWRWVNAYALTGGPVPVNLPLEVTVIRWG